MKELIGKGRTLFTQSKETQKKSKDEPQNLLSAKQTQANSYVLMVSPIEFQNLDAKKILDGCYDAHYKDSNNTQKPSIVFYARCQQYDSLEDARESARYNKGAKTPKSVYIMEMGYTKEEVAQITANGEFSKGIIRAVNGKDLGKVQLGILNLAEVEKIENPGYKNNLLAKDSIEYLNSTHSNICSL